MGSNSYGSYGSQNTTPKKSPLGINVGNAPSSYSGDMSNTYGPMSNDNIGSSYNNTATPGVTTPPATPPASQGSGSVATPYDLTSMSNSINQLASNSPYQQGTAAYNARYNQNETNINSDYAGARQNMMNQMSSSGISGGGLTGAMANMSANQAAAQNSMTNEMLSNDPTRQTSYLQGVLGLGGTVQQQSAYSQLTPLQIAAAGLQNTSAQQGINDTSQMFPLLTTAQSDQNAGSEANTQKIIATLPADVRQAAANADLTEANATTAQWLATNQGPLAAMSFITSLVGAGGKAAGAAAALG